MANNFTMSVGQAHELEMAMNRVGKWDATLVKQLSMGENLAWVRDVLKGTREVKEANYLIDCSTQPFIPNGWGVLPDDEQLPNRFRGILNCNETKIRLYLAEGQQGGKSMTGHQLREVLKTERVLPANVLDDLLKTENQHLIPEEWKTHYICFWGTIYRRSGDGLCVRCLGWDGGRWRWGCIWLVDDWRVVYPAAVLAS